MRSNITPGGFYLPKSLKLKDGGKVKSLTQRSQELKARIKPKNCYAEGGEVGMSDEEVMAAEAAQGLSDEEVMAAEAKGQPADSADPQRNPYLTAAMRGVANLAGTPADIAGIVGDVAGWAVNRAAPVSPTLSTLITGKTPTRSEWLNEKMAEYFPNLAKARKYAAKSTLLSPTSENIKRAMGVEKRPEGFGPAALEGAITYATPGGVGKGVATAGKALLRSVVPGAIAGAVGEAGSMVGGEIGRAVGEVGTIGARSLPALARTITKPFSTAARATEAMKKFSDAGFVVPPSRVTKPGVVSSTLEKVAGKQELADLASFKNQEATNRAIAKDLGLAPDTLLTDDLLKERRAAAGQVYGRVAALPVDLEYTPQFSKAIEEIGDDYIAAAKEFPDLLRNTDTEDLVGSLLSRDSMSPQAAVQLSKRMREAAKANFRAGGDERVTLARAQSKAAHEIDKLIESNVADPKYRSRTYAAQRATGQTPVPIKELPEQLKAARREIAKLHDAEAALNPETGNISANYFGNKLANAKTRGSLTGGARLVAEFNKAHPTMSKSTERLTRPLEVDPRLAAAALASSLATGGIHPLAAPLAAATTVPVVRAGARAHLLRNKAGRQLGIEDASRLARTAPAISEALRIPITTRADSAEPQPFAKGGYVRKAAQRLDRIFDKHPGLLDSLGEDERKALTTAFSFSGKPEEAMVLVDELRAHARKGRKSKDKLAVVQSRLANLLAAHFSEGGAAPRMRDLASTALD